jgi:hypothetical protein
MVKNVSDFAYTLLCKTEPMGTVGFFVIIGGCVDVVGSYGAV